MRTEHNEEFARIIRQIIASRGIKQSWLAEMLGVEKSCVSKWVKGKNAPGYSTLINLSRVLDMNPAEFFPNKKRMKKETA